MKTTEEPKFDQNGVKLLPVAFTEDDFTFMQVFRDDKTAIYFKTKPGTAIKNWEAIRIQRHNGLQRFGKVYPPSEYYPSSEQFGTEAYSCVSLERAQARVKELAN